MYQKTWPTQFRDMLIAEHIMAQFREEHGALGLFELVVDLKEKSMDFELSAWVKVLAMQYQLLYGEEEGERVTRRVISQCMRDNEILH